jgi:hypothetical protein
MWTTAKDIAERIDDALVALKAGGVSAEEEAARIELRAEQLSRWRTGKEANPRVRTLARWARQRGWPVTVWQEGGPMPSQFVNRPVNGVGDDGPVFVPTATRAALTRLMGLVEKAGPDGTVPAELVRAAVMETAMALGWDAATLAREAAPAARGGSGPPLQRALRGAAPPSRGPAPPR